MALDIQKLSGMEAELTADCTSVTMGAIVNCKMGRYQEFFYLAPAGGGQELELDGDTITVVFPNSPLYQLLLDKQTGDHFTMPNGVGRVIGDVF